MSAEQEARAALARARLEPYPEELPILTEMYIELRAQMDRLDAITEADEEPPTLGLEPPPNVEPG